MTWTLPPRTLLDPPPAKPLPEVLRTAEVRRALLGAKVDVASVDHAMGPTVVRYLVELAPGVVPSKVERAIDAVSLAVGAPVRYAGTDAGRVVLEVPRERRETVGLRPTLEALPALVKLGFPLGLDAAGNAVPAHLVDLPHLLVAGTTGSGKSSFLNALLCGLLLRQTPADMRLVIIDPKRVEMALYADLPHLARPVVTDVHLALDVLREVVADMDARYSAFEDLGVKDLQGFNDRATERLPRLVVVVEEYADLILTAGKSVEESLVRIAQLGRAAGIHLVLATQQPLATVVTSLLKANIPSRAVFRVADHTASRVALGSSGAERLVGNGDGLFLTPALGTAPLRFQSPYVPEAEVARVVQFWAEQRQDVEPEAEEAPVVDLEAERREAQYREELDARVAARLTSRPEGRRQPGTEYVSADDVLADSGLDEDVIEALVEKVLDRVLELLEKAQSDAA